MREFTIYDTATGTILRNGYCPEDDFIYQAQAGESIIVGVFHPDDFYISEGDAVNKLIRPGNFYLWDEVNHVWLPDLPQARLAVKARVEIQQALLDNSLVEYDGKALDADSTARANIQGKLAELLAASDLGQAVETPLVWRDADNITHGWQTVEDYKAWLQGLVIAITSRSTALYIAAWTHKAAIDALETVPEIESYDTGVDWP